MYERTFTYKGFDGKTYSDTYNFYLSKADLLEIHLGTFVGLDVLLKQLVETKNGKEIMAIVKEFIMKSVGRVSSDGRRFVRNDEIREEFLETPAYSELFEELVLDPNKVIEFLSNVTPEEVGSKMRELHAQAEAEKPTIAADTKAE